MAVHSWKLPLVIHLSLLLPLIILYTLGNSDPSSIRVTYEPSLVSSPVSSLRHSYHLYPPRSLINTLYTFQTWYAKTPLGKKRAKAAAGDDKGGKKGKNAGEKGEKKKKK